MVSLLKKMFMIIPKDKTIQISKTYEFPFICSPEHHANGFCILDLIVMFVRTKHSVLMWVGLNIWDTSSNHLNENMGCVILKQTYGILWVLFYVTCELNISTRTFYHLSWSCWSPLFQCQWQPQCRSLKQVWTLPSGNLTLLLKIAIYSGFTHWKWWFSIVFCMFTRGQHAHTHTVAVPPEPTQLDQPTWVGSTWEFRQETHGCLLWKVGFP